MKIRLKRLDPNIPLPFCEHPGDAGYDLYSRVELTLEPGQRQVVPTGIAMAIPKGFAGFILPRSGLAAKRGISIVNTPGLIDSSYRGEIKVVLINLDSASVFHIRPGDRIAQFLVHQVESVSFEVVEDLGQTKRGISGFGSTG